ncbi:tyrosine-protein phosphatase [Telluribacter humicola]|uniref:tyrosine-protein phosphatase n=1 Tax=Telluribacter humicola TaxID=1720261 RepID=UPI001A956D9A|nr:CpsB/CapC family capsule biosynthesis tyrosine phosphatase [Telluribacter humicola]
MFSWLFEKKKKSLDLSRIRTDIHSHLIPGIDDGVQTLEESVHMIRRLQEYGYQRVFTTPHVIWDCYKNTPEIILGGLAQVQAACKEAGLTVEVGAAAEYFIDEHFIEMLEGKQPLLTLPGNRLLVELPYSSPLMNVSETLFSIIQHGYRPVLAHPERYTYFYSDPSIYRKLSNQGCELQVNLLSLTSHYGEGIQRMAEWLLREGLITFLGTDAHKIQHLDLARRLMNSSWLENYPFKNDQLVQ